MLSQWPKELLNGRNQMIRTSFPQPIREDLNEVVPTELQYHIHDEVPQIGVPLHGK